MVYIQLMTIFICCIGQEHKVLLQFLFTTAMSTASFTSLYPEQNSLSTSLAQHLPRVDRFFFIQIAIMQILDNFKRAAIALTFIPNAVVAVAAEEQSYRWDCTVRLFYTKAGWSQVRSDYIHVPPQGTLVNYDYASLRWGIEVTPGCVGRKLGIMAKGYWVTVSDWENKNIQLIKEPVWS